MRAAAATIRIIPRAAGVLPRAIGLSPHGRRRLTVLAVIAAALAAGYMFWLRDSSLVRVERVTITGLTTPDGDAVRAKLTAAARRMTTLHVHEATLRLAVADEPIVESIQVRADFPHALRIAVVENRPVAMLVGGGRQVAVAPDGSLLQGEKPQEGLPTVHVGSLPSGGRMAGGATRELVAVAAAAPPRLLGRVASVQVQRGRGLVAVLQNGPVVVFGHGDQLALKWTAAAGVLAQKSSQGATYVDVRMPLRPVAGGLDLQQDPQPQASPPDTGAGSRTPGVIPADPGAVPATAAGAPAPQGAAPATAAPAAPVAPSTTPSPAATQSQP